jgi:hypothetical protein
MLDRTSHHPLSVSEHHEEYRREQFQAGYGVTRRRLYSCAPGDVETHKVQRRGHYSDLQVYSQRGFAPHWCLLPWHERGCPGLCPPGNNEEDLFLRYSQRNQWTRGGGLPPCKDPTIEGTKACLTEGLDVLDGCERLGSNWRGKAWNLPICT